MKLEEQSEEAIQEYKKRKLELVKEIEKYLIKKAIKLYDICGQELRLIYKYPDQGENERPPRLICIELAHSSHNKTSFSFQFPSRKEYGGVRSDAIVVNMVKLPEHELMELLKSFSLDEKREITVEEIW